MYLITDRFADSEIKYLSHQLTYMRAFGMWNDLVGRKKRLVYSCFTYFIFTVQFIHLFCSVAHFITSKKIAGLNLLLFTIGIIAKEIVIVRNQQKLTSLLQLMQQVLDNVPPSRKRIVVRCEQLGRLLIDVSLFAGSFVVIFVHTHSLVALFSPYVDRVLPHKVLYPFDERTQFGHLVALFLQTTYGPLSAAITIPIHIIPISIMIHLCGQLKVLNDDLRDMEQRVAMQWEEEKRLKAEERRVDRLGHFQNRSLEMDLKTWKINEQRMLTRDSRNNNLAKVPSKAAVLGEEKKDCAQQHLAGKRRLDDLSETAIIDCIRHHETIYRLARDLQNIYGPIFFSHLFVNSFSIWLLLYEITTQMNNNLFGMLGYIIYLTMSLMDIAIVCSVGSELMSRSVDISDTAYTTQWYTSSRRFKFMVGRMIHRAQKPILMQGAYIFQLTKRTLFLILKASISNFTVIMEVQSGKAANSS